MTKSHRKYAETYAKNMVDEFVNHPEYHGPKFTFDKLPDMVMRFARTHSCLSFAKIKQHDATEIGELAREMAETILKEKRLVGLLGD